MQNQENSRSLKKRKTEEFIVVNILRISGALSIITTVGIISILGVNSIPFFQEVGLKEFLTGLKWTPLFIPQNFGILPLVNGTFLVAFIAAITALVFGLGSAFYLSEYASRRVRRIIKPLLEILAGIPTVVYGYFALTFVTPVIQFFFPQTIIFNALSAGLVMGIMIIPMQNTSLIELTKIYRKTRKLRDIIQKDINTNCNNLSMGMSNDYTVAIKEGATHIRLGTALFGLRDK